MDSQRYQLSSNTQPDLQEQTANNPKSNKQKKKKKKKKPTSESSINTYIHNIPIFNTSPTP
jgi:hypothetical protein